MKFHNAVLALAAIACGFVEATDAGTPGPEALLHSIESAHAGEIYNSRDAVQADFELSGFGGMQVAGTMTFTPSMGKVRMELDDDTVLIYDGKTAWKSPADAELPGPPARFHVLTWPYFVAVPYKLDDPGTKHELIDVSSPENSQPQAVKVSFDQGVGDTPDDWYIAFHDDQNRLNALAYIVTYGKDQAEAEQKPSIVLYSDWIEVDGVPFATTWTFHYWDEKQGVTGDAKGSATLSNITFLSPREDAFVKPGDATEAPSP